MERSVNTIGSSNEETLVWIKLTCVVLEDRAKRIKPGYEAVVDQG